MLYGIYCVSLYCIITIIALEMNDIQKMLSTAYELEGLLLLARQRESDVPSAVIDGIRNKISELGKLAATAMQGEQEANMPNNAVSTPAETAFDTDELQYELDHDSIEIAEPRNIRTEYESDESDLLTSIVTSDSESTTASLEAIEYTPEEELPQEEIEQEEINEPQTIPAAVTYQEETNPDETSSQEASEEESPSEPITLDKVLTRNKSKELRSAFSINDMFRFRRELFGNSAADMTDALNLVEAMGNYAEAEDYFYNDLGWDKDSEEVVEFMDIIKNHFS